MALARAQTHLTVSSDAWTLARADTDLPPHLPRDIAADSTGIVVADDAALGLVFLTPGLTRAIGAQGGAPGEMRGPESVVIVGDTIAVAEATNGRISLFSRTGGFLRVSRVPNGAAQFALAPDGTLFVNAQRASHYLLAVSTNGDASPFGERVLDLYGRGDMSGERPRGVGLELVARTYDGAVHVFDNQLGMLIRLDRMGRRTMMRRLPEHVEEILLANRARTIDGLVRSGVSVVAVPLAKRLSVADDGRLFLLLRGPELCGLLIDPSSYAAELVVLPAIDSTARAVLRSAVAAAILRDTLHTVGADGLMSFTMRQVVR